MNGNSSIIPISYITYNTYSYYNVITITVYQTCLKALRSTNSSKWYGGVLSVAINIYTADYYINDKILDIIIISQYF